MRATLVSVVVLACTALAGCHSLRRDRPAGPQFPACPKFSVGTGNPVKITIERTAHVVTTGDVTLIVPAGAVNAPVEVQVFRGGTKPNAAAVRFEPAGGSLTFAQPVTLRISYSACPAPFQNKQAKMFRVDQGDQELPGSRKASMYEYVEGTLSSMSEYAVATM